MSASSDTRILITGGNGFLGHHLTKRLLGLGSKITILDVLRSNEWDKTTVEQISIDITDSDAVRAVFKESKPDIVYHLAAAGVTDPFLHHALAIEANILGSLNIAQAAFENGAKRIVVAGTSHEYGDSCVQGEIDPISIYAASKAAAWAFLRAYHRMQNWPIVYLRFFQVYGPGQKGTLIPSALEHVKANHSFHTTAGEQIRDWVYIDDVIDALIIAGSTQNIEGKAFDVGTCEGHSVREVIAALFYHFPDSQFSIGSLPYRPGETWNLTAQRERLLPNWLPNTTLTEGLDRTIVAFLATDGPSTP